MTYLLRCCVFLHAMHQQLHAPETVLFVAYLLLEVLLQVEAGSMFFFQACFSYSGDNLVSCLFLNYVFLFPGNADVFWLDQIPSSVLEKSIASAYLTQHDYDSFGCRVSSAELYSASVCMFVNVWYVRLNWVIACSLLIACKIKHNNNKKALRGQHVWDDLSPSSLT